MSHFKAVGFDFKSPEEMRDVIARVIDSGNNLTKFKTKKGTYIKYVDPSGAELWIQDSGKGSGLHPFFSGESERKVRIEKKIKKGTVLDGMYYAWSPEIKKSDIEHPLIFECVDFLAFSDNIKIGDEYLIQMTAFPNNYIETFSSYEEFESEKVLGGLGAHSFIPTGTFYPGEDREREDPVALFGGTVQSLQTKVNEFTEQSFEYAVVETLNGNIDVVFTKEQVNGEVKEGSIILVDCWLVGRFIGVDPSKGKEGILSSIFSWK